MGSKYNKYTLCKNREFFRVTLSSVCLFFNRQMLLFLKKIDSIYIKTHIDKSDYYFFVSCSANSSKGGMPSLQKFSGWKNRSEEKRRKKYVISSIACVAFMSSSFYFFLFPPYSWAFFRIHAFLKCFGIFPAKWARDSSSYIESAN